MEVATASKPKLGALLGVIVPNLLQMAGVVVFFRLGWIVGHIGISLMSIIIAIASCLLVITALSFSSIISNMKVGSGGGYFIISRILGIEMGGAIGILLCLMQITSISLCISGFASSFTEFFPSFSLPLVEIATLCALVGITYISTSFAMQIQLFIFVALFTCLSSIFLGSYSPQEGASIIPANLSFWMAFAIFFPATTGIEAGMSLSGELKNPRRALPLGTLFSVFFASILYFSLSFFLSQKVPAHILRENPSIVFYIAKIKYFVFAGVWGAILSSALSNILGAPRVIQAIAKDGILPYLLAKGRSKTGEPVTATFVVFIATLVITLTTQLNHLIPVLTMICLSSYALINFVAFFEGFFRKPSWRPSFEMPWAIPLFGSLGCFAAMFLINAGAAFIVIALAIGLCLWTSSRKIHGNWDDIRHSLFSFLIFRAANKLQDLRPNPRSWRPHVLTLFPPSGIEKNCAFFSHALDHGKGFLTFATSSQKEKAEDGTRQRLHDFHIPAYVHVNFCEDTLQSTQQIIMNYGFGPLRPNTILLPLDSFSTKNICHILQQAAHFGKNILLFKDDPHNIRLYSENATTPKQINLWWRGQNQKNFELCLALSHTLQSSQFWNRAKICIKSIVKDERSKTKLLHVFQRYHQRLRMRNLIFSPIVDPSESFFPNLKEHSKDADFTFLGLKTPIDETYETYLSTVLKETEDLKNIAFVLAGEDLKFEKIFD